MHDTSRTFVVPSSELSLLAQMSGPIWAWERRRALALARWVTLPLAALVTIAIVAMLWTAPPYWLYWWSWQEMLQLIGTLTGGWAMLKTASLTRQLRWASDPVVERTAKLAQRVRKYNAVAYPHDVCLRDSAFAAEHLAADRLSMHVRRTHLLACYERLVPELGPWLRANTGFWPRFPKLPTLRPTLMPVSIENK